MSRGLASVIKGKIKRPYAIVIYGVDGVGKTKFGANAPKPIFLGPERGSNNMEVERFPAPETWADQRTDIKTLIKESHGYQTAVLDSLDWLEPLLQRHIMALDGAKSMELSAGGYGKAYKLASAEWREFTADLDLLRDKGMHVIAIAHCKVIDFNDPQVQANYNRYQMKLRDEDSAWFREWSDAVLFANHETFTETDGKRTRAFGSGDRILYTNRDAGFDAKNRLGLPSKLEFKKDTSWADFVAAAEVSDGESADAVYMRIVGLMSQMVNPDQKKLISDYIDKPIVRQNVAQLIAAEQRVTKLLIVQPEVHA